MVLIPALVNRLLTAVVGVAHHPVDAAQAANRTVTQASATVTIVGADVSVGVIGRIGFIVTALVDTFAVYTVCIAASIVPASDEHASIAFGVMCCVTTAISVGAGRSLAVVICSSVQIIISLIRPAAPTAIILIGAAFMATASLASVMGRFGDGTNA
jgi:hypothetical protein